MRVLRALCGMVLSAAATLVAKLGDITRFDNLRQLMAYLGLVLSEHSSGTTRRQGAITKAGNGAARRSRSPLFKSRPETTAHCSILQFLAPVPLLLTHMPCFVWSHMSEADRVSSHMTK